MNEKPLERLNYFNGQRLQAADFKLEQEYQIRVRRWLNRSLHTPGIASGLQVYAIKDAPRVKVLPGLAIDYLGREIILLEEQDVPVAGHGSKKKGNGTSDDVDKDKSKDNGNGACSGPYLTIRYQEEVIAQQDACCAVGGNSTNKAAWGGPARILAEPVLELNDELPHESSGKIALACITLAKGCASIDRVDTGVRRYIGEASAAKVRQYALEGERHIDPDPVNRGRIYFHIRGRQPNSVSLYLRAAQFSKLFYTELGQHSHGTSAAGFSVTVPEHRHTLTPASTGTADIDDILADVSGALTRPVHYSIIAGPPGRQASLKDWMTTSITFQPAGPLPGQHWHSIPSQTVTQPAQAVDLAGAGNSGPAGVADVIARNDPEKALSYVDDLRVFMGPDINRLVELTDDILDQLRVTQSSTTWDKLGNGTEGHALAVTGSGEIRLDFLPNVSFAEGEYVIELRVASGGGRVLYNLYVE